jgi:hypothetical protein
MNQNALQVSVITPAAAAQLALWDRISQIRPRPAVDFFSTVDIFNQIIPKPQWGYYTRMDTILGFLNLVSACKKTRACVPLMIGWLQRNLIPPEPMTFIPLSVAPFCWATTQGLSVGEHIMLFMNYRQFPEPRRLHFRFPSEDPALTLVSRVSAGDLTSDCTGTPGFFMGLESCWRPPLPAPAEWIGEILLQFQMSGDLSTLCKYGFFSTEVNRFALESVLQIIKKPRLSDSFVRCPRQLNFLEWICKTSYSVVDLTPPLQRRVSDTEFLPQIHGLHVCINPSDIAIVNAFSRDSSVRVSFDLVGAPLG